jgi:hypothetical protein
MRFFSNDAKETHEDDTDRPEDAPSVPQQRIGSPWSDSRDVTDRADATDRADVTDQTDVTDHPSVNDHTDLADRPDGSDADPTDEHVDPQLLDGEPAEAKTNTFGEHTADTVHGEPVVGEGGHNAHDLGGPESSTVEHDDLDLPLDEQPANTAAGTDLDSTGLDSTDLDGTGPSDTDRVDGRTGDTEPFVSESTVTSPDAPVDEPTDAETTGSAGDPAIRDEGDFDEPHAVDPATDKTLDTDDDSDSDSDDVTATEIDAPVAVTPVDSDSTTYASAAADTDTATDDTVLDDTATDDTAPAFVPAGDTAVVAAVPVAVVADTTSTSTSTDSAAPAKPGAVEEKNLDSLFGADAAKTFQERWRDVQLRFVDSPKDATAEAAGLVDEAVDQLTASLKSQKDGLLSDSEDTEKLRMELRGYRDILNRVLSL